MPFRNHGISYGMQKPPAGAVLNRAHPLAQGMVAGFLFNENGGAVAKDITGNGWDLFAAYGGTGGGTGKPAYTPNPFLKFATGSSVPIIAPSAGKSITFPAQGNHQVMKSKKTSKLLSNTSPYTVVVKYRTTGGSPLAGEVLVSKWDADLNHGFAVCKYFGGTGQGIVLPNDNTDTVALAGGFGQGQVVDNAWYVLGVSGVPLAFPTVFVNGIARALSTSAAGTGNHNDDSTFPLCVGGFEISGTTGLDYFQGAIDYVYIYRRKLTPAEHRKLCFQPFSMIQMPKRRISSHFDLSPPFALESRVLMNADKTTRIAFEGNVP